jgi:hypothetical protein
VNVDPEISELIGNRILDLYEQTGPVELGYSDIST